MEEEQNISIEERTLAKELNRLNDELKENIRFLDKVAYNKEMYLEGKARITEVYYKLNQTERLIKLLGFDVCHVKEIAELENVKQKDWKE